MTGAQPLKPKRSKSPAAKLSAAALRKLAQVHSEAALQVLAEVAINGKSEASRISAAMALLDRGYGKSGVGVALEGGAHPPVLYHWIELIDGTEDKTSPRHPAPDDKTSDDKN